MRMTVCLVQKETLEEDGNTTLCGRIFPRSGVEEDLTKVTPETSQKCDRCEAAAMSTARDSGKLQVHPVALRVGVGVGLDLLRRI